MRLGLKMVKKVAPTIVEALSLVAGVVVFTIAATIVITLLLGLVIITEAGSRLHSA